MTKSNQPKISAAQIAQAEAQIQDQLKKIDYYITEYSLELLIDKLDREEIIIPDYQRAFVWEHERKCRFIESLLMQLPIPFLFFWLNKDGQLEIVDGSQRLRTIQSFLKGGLILNNLSILNKVSNITFKDFPAQRQRKFKNLSIKGIVLNEQIDQATILEIFDRINTGSKNANTTEIRRGALAGPFMDMIIELSKSKKLAQLAPISAKKVNARQYEELLTRFYAYSDGLEGYSDSVSTFLNNYVIKMNQEFSHQPSLKEIYIQNFNKMLNFVEIYFPNGFTKGPRNKDTPNARFESISVGVLNALKQFPSKNIDVENIPMWIMDKEFLTVTGSDGSNVKRKLESRLSYVTNKLIKNHE